MEALGRYFTEFATLEFAMLTVFSHILGHGKNNEVAGAVLKRVRSIAERIEILRDCAIASQFEEKVLDAVNALCDTFAEVNARRNTYAHSIYGPDDVGGVRIKTYVFSAGRKQKIESLTVEQIEQDILRARAALTLAAIWTGQLPPLPGKSA